MPITSSFRPAPLPRACSNISRWLIGLAAGLLSFIPYFGSLAGFVVSTCVAVAQFWPELTPILFVPAIFFTGQFLADYVLAPYLVGRRVHLNPVWVMFALFAFAYLFGFVGLLIAVPVAAAIGVLMRFAFQQYYASSLYALTNAVTTTTTEPATPLIKTADRSNVVDLDP
jgi:predicted PurR-regulated permease PerM